MTGLSPQVVTETLYVLVTEQNWVPQHIKIITTAEGAKRAKLSLLSDDPGWFHRLCTDFSLPPIRFSEEDILVLGQENGKMMEDIRTPLDNERMADFIVEQVRQLTSDQRNELHVSIAGGRKTMGFYLGYALSLFGRTQDKLSHVLVTEPFESCWDFFYPTPYSRVIQTNDQNLADTRDAKISLAEIPFVSLRHAMTENFLGGDVSFGTVVDAVSRSLAPPRLIIDLKSQRIEAAGTVIRVPPTELALLSLFARRLLSCEPPVLAPNKEVPDTEWADRYLDEYDLIKGEWGDTDLTRKALKIGMDGKYFSSCKSNLHRTLKKTLGIAADPYLIDDGNQRPRRYSLALSKEALEYRKLVITTES